MSKPDFRVLLSLCVLALLVGLASPPAVAATPAAMHGLPLMQRYDNEELPAPPAAYGGGGVVVDASGNLYVASSEGVLAYRGGGWDVVELPRKSGAASLLATSDGKLYVDGPNLFGELHREPDGNLHFVDLLAKFADGGKPIGFDGFNNLVETSRGVYFNGNASLYLLGRDGSAKRWSMPPETRQMLFAVDDEVYVRVGGVGLCRIEDGTPVPLPGAKTFAQLPFIGMWAYRSGLLIAAFDGFYYADAGGVAKLHGAADAAFAAHQPYASRRLPDGSFVLGGFDGTLMHFSPELRLLDSFALGSGAITDFGVDKEGGLWVSGENGVVRLRLPSPWTIYDQRQGLDNIVYDSAWYDGAVWVGSTDVRRAEATRDGAIPRFMAKGWVENDLEAFALESTARGLLIGDRTGVVVVEPGANEPRTLLRQVLGDSGVETLQVSRFDAAHVLALGGNEANSREAAWLSLRDGHWQLAAKWDSQIGSPNGAYETAPGEFWIGDRYGGALRWRIDPGTGALRERRRFGAEEGLLTDADLGTHLFALDGVLYAISGERVQELQGERFVPAQLPPLPGLERPWELKSDANALGTFVWTSRQLWRRLPKQAAFQPLHVSNSRVPGYRSVKLQGDGKLRIAIGNALLQFDPDIAEPEPPALQTSLVFIQQLKLTPNGEKRVRLPLVPPETAPVLVPGSGLGLRFGLATMEPNVEYRYRMSGYGTEWSAWSNDPLLSYRLLPPGAHVFELQSRIRGGREAAPLRYPLWVQPYWYERHWVRTLAWLAGALVVVAIALIVAWWRNRQITAHNRELEQRISERTDELEQANRKLSELATQDGLTGLANRRAMEAALQREWQRCRERGEPMALVMSDVDQFKQFNDTHGHPAGDAQLRRIARAVGEEVAAAGELAARYGGEEFVLILPGSSREQAIARAESLRRRIACATAAEGLPGSASFGVAAAMPAADMAPADLLRRADEALYRAKHNGRDRVEAAD